MQPLLKVSCASLGRTRPRIPGANTTITTRRRSPIPQPNPRAPWAKHRMLRWAFCCRCAVAPGRTANQESEVQNVDCILRLLLATIVDWQANLRWEEALLSPTRPRSNILREHFLEDVEWTWTDRPDKPQHHHCVSTWQQPYDMK